MYLQKFGKKIGTNDFLLTCELAPPKGPAVADQIKLVSGLVGLVDAVNITDGQNGRMRMSSVIFSHLIEREAGLETICQLVCRDRNRIGLQGDLLGAYALGLRNFLLLSGDKCADGDHPEAKDVFDLNTDQLVDVFAQLKGGYDMAGNALNGLVSGCAIGAAAHPGVPDLAGQALKMQARAERGVRFFQTQIIYDLEQMSAFQASLGDSFKPPVLLGITPLKSIKSATFMNEKLYGVSVPPAVFARLEGASDQAEEGFLIALELIKAYKAAGGRGIHLMPVGQEKRLAEFLGRIKAEIG